ncbi:MAG: septal ring lytic transglycosylase RlpA family protein [Pseudomonadaceae bacterium]|nr:septal ring lytic transglycosylase RlpA family protein [Pseudomonadaceae bacterium]
MYKRIPFPYWSMYKIPLKALLTAALLAGCTEVQVGSHLLKKGLGTYSCKDEGDMKVGAPYKVDGIRYEPVVSSLGYSERGVASWYGEDFHGKPTANGECYNMYAFTAAHKTLPLPSIVRVTNLENNRSVVLKVNDRGPFVRGRLIDLSYAAAQSLDVVRGGTAPVLVEAIGGPHHYAGGLKGNTQLASQLPNLRLGMPAQPVVQTAAAPTLPSYVPPSIEAEALPPLDGTATVLTAPQTDVQTPLPPTEIAKLEAEVPAAAANLPPPPPEAARVHADTTPLVRTNVFVQVGAYGSVANAERQLDALRAAEPTAALSKVEGPSGTLTRVRSGPYASLAEAEIALEKLVAAGFAGARLVVEGR